MNVERVIKSPNVIMGPPVMVGGGIPILQQAEAIASAAWNRFEVPKAFHTALADVNLDPSIPLSVPKFDILKEVNQVAEVAWNRPQLSWWLVPTIAVRYSLPSIQPQAAPIEPIIPTRVEPSWQPTNKTDQAVARTVPSTNPLLKQAEQLTEETEIVAKPTDQDKIRLAEQQNLEEERLINVEDWQVVEQRRYEISQAVNQAVAEAKKFAIKKIFGWMVVRFLPTEHQGNRSQIIKKTGPDGSLVDTKQAIRTDPRQFLSEQEAKSELLPYVSIYKPVKKAKEGKRVGIHDVIRVLKYLPFKPMLAYEVFVQRIIKKKVQVSGPEETETKAEGSLADYPELSAVFND